MKNPIALLASVCLFLASCNTAKVAVQENVLGVESAVPTIAADEQSTALLPVAAVEEQHASAIHVNDVPAAGEISTDGLLAMASEENSGMDQRQMALKVAEDLRTLSKDIDSRIASRILNKTANRIETADFSEGKKLTLWERMKKNIASRFVSRYADKLAAGGGMDTADILAITSLASGGLAWIAYYGSFLFGLAGIALGIVALKKGTSRRGMAIAGIALGATAILFWILLIAVVFTVV